MNKRSSLSKLLVLGIAPMILPSALTYSRIWKPKPVFTSEFDSFVNSGLDLNELAKTLFAIKRQREASGNHVNITLWCPVSDWPLVEQRLNHIVAAYSVDHGKP